MDKIALFINEYDFLSNFYPAEFDWEGHVWPTVEHAYQAQKSIFCVERETIRLAPTPGKAKHLGRKVRLRPYWDSIRVPAMTEFVWEKFDQNRRLLKELIDTGDAQLVEGNYWHDNFWGDCYCSNCLKIKGENMLGFILMQVRKNLIKPGHISSALVKNEFIPSVLREEEFPVADD